MNISKTADGIKVVLDGCDATIPESQLKQLRATAKTGHKNSQRDCDDDTVHWVRTARKGRVILTLLNGGRDSRIEMIPFRCRKAIASRILQSAEAVKSLELTKGS